MTSTTRPSEDDTFASPGALLAVFLDERPGAMDLPILTDDEIAEVVKELRVRLARRPCAAEGRA